MGENIFDYQLTPKQQEAVDFTGEHMLIKGIAGSGKTTVLLRKARKIVENDPNATVAIFTYNNTLATFARGLAQHLQTERIQVYTFHSWASKILWKMKLKKGTATGRTQRSLFQNALRSVSIGKAHRFFSEKKYEEFLMDEISWMKGKGIVTLDSYLSAERTGRGTKVRVTEGDREAIFALYEGYQAQLAKVGKIDFDDYAPRILENFSRFPTAEKPDHIFVDEAQDLQQVQLLLLRKAAKQAMVVAADKGQKIYKTSFSWREIGINIQGRRTKVLQNSFRSTRQIIQLAHSLQKHDPICKQKDEDYIEPVYPEVQGPVPKVLACRSELQEEEMMVKIAKALWNENQNVTIGVLNRKWDPLNSYQRRLQTEGIPCEIIRNDQGDVNTPGVKLTTFHSAKGLEFDAVILTGLNEENVPLIEKGQEEDEEVLAVERRLVYVSMTRAKKELYILYAGQPSRFFEEMDKSLYKKESL